MSAQEIPLAGFQSKLLGRTEVAADTQAFHVAKPKGFSFKAGQAADFTLVNPPETDPEGNTRTFSIVSAPFEDQLTFATRMRDTAFKRSLKTIPLPAEINISPPTGSFSLHKSAGKPAVFLAGGIGITPFFSIVKQAHHDRLPHALYLFYSNRRPEDAAFLEALQDLEKTNPSFRLIATMSQAARSRREWSGNTGLINHELLANHVSKLQGPIYYIAGPPRMVAAMRDMLVRSGIDEDDIRAEDFAGY